MRRTRVLLCAAVAVWVLLTTVSFAFENEPEGFRGLKWGDPPTEDMELVETAPWGTTVFMKMNDKMSIGEVPLVYITYHFFDNEFMSVYMKFKDDHNYGILALICQERFGQPTEREIHELVWLSVDIEPDLDVPDMAVILSYDRIGNEGYLMLIYHPLFLEHVAAGKKHQAATTTEDDW